MKQVQITVMRTARYDGLIERYENPIRPVSFLIEAWDEEAGA